MDDDRKGRQKGVENMERLKGENIAERLLDFSVRILKLADSLPKSPSTSHISMQIVRSGTSAGANYEEARGAESDKDFIHKLGICLKELRESRYWLRVIERAGKFPNGRMEQIIQESDELCRIIGQSILTARKSKNDK